MPDNASQSTPDFLYIGPDKSGSSWLFKMLETHPECFVPACKDIYYFDKYYHRGKGWYESFFKTTENNIKIKGEISHGYLFDRVAAERIYENYPNIKLITTLRNPVERSISHYFYLKSSGLIRTPILEAIKERPGIIKSSLYSEHVKNYLNIFGPDALKINYFDDLVCNPKEFAFDTFDFLGISCLEEINYSQRVREARKPKNYFLSKILKVAAMRARDLGFTNIVGRIKNSDIVGVLYSPLSSKDKSQIDDEVRLELFKYFEADIVCLEELLGKNLSHWKYDFGSIRRDVEHDAA